MKLKSLVLMAGGMAVALSMAGYYVSKLRSWQSIYATVSPHRRPLPSSSDAGMAGGDRVTGGGGLQVLRHDGTSPNFTSALITSSVVGVSPRFVVPHEKEYSLPGFVELGFTGEELDTPKGSSAMEKEIADVKNVMVKLRNSLSALQEREEKLELDGLKDPEAVLTLRELKDGIKITDTDVLDMKEEIAELRGVVQALHDGGKQVEFDDLKDQEAASALRGIKNAMEIANMEAIGMKQEIAEIKIYVQALQEGNHNTEYDYGFKDQVAVMKELEHNMKITYVEVLNMKQEMQEKLEIGGYKEQEAVERELGNNTKIDDMKQDINKLRNIVQTLQETERNLDMNRFKEQETIIREVENRVKDSGIEVLDLKRESVELRNSVHICLEEMKKQQQLGHDILREQGAILKELINHAEVAELEALGIKQEVAELKDSIHKLQEFNRKFEFQVLESNSHKEQEAIARELELHQQIADLEDQFFREMESVKSYNKLFEAQLSSHSKMTSELDTAREKVRTLKRRLRSNSLQAKEKIAALRKKTVKLQNDKGAMMKRVQDVEGDLSRLKDVEDEAAQLRSENSILAQQNFDLSKKLESAEILLSTNSVNQEGNDAVEEVNHLRQTNKELQMKIDQLQTDQCSELQQQVYLRWINACLRYELRNHQPPPGKLVAKDLNYGSSPRSAEKAKELIFEYAYSDNDEESLTDMDLENWFSSQSSSQVEIEIEEPNDDVISTIRDDKRPSGGKPKFLSKLKKLVQKKDGKKESKRRSLMQATPTRPSCHSTRKSINSCLPIDTAQGRRSTDSRIDSLLHSDMCASEAAKIIIGGGRCKSDLGGCNRFVRNEATWNGGSPRVPLFCHGREETPEKTQLKKYAIALKTSTW